MTYVVRTAFADDLEQMANLAATCQADAERYCCYVGDDAASIAADVAEIGDWASATRLVLDEGRTLLGWLAADVDAEMGRVWWWGPFVDPRIDADEADDISDALWRASELDPSISEHELAVDSRSDFMRRFGERHGFVAEEGSVLLATQGRPDVEREEDSSFRVRAVDATTAPIVAALHDEVFAGTHTTGAALVRGADERHLRLVAVDTAGEVVGYIATELQNDGSCYVDFLGVVESRRRDGIGRRLITAALAHPSMSTMSNAHLTVRESSVAARRLYASLGFDEVRILVPFRRGFSLA